MLTSFIPEPIKPVIDGTAIGGGIAVFFKLIPEISGIFALAYLLIRIWETDTVQGWFNRKKDK